MEHAEVLPVGDGDLPHKLVEMVVGGVHQGTWCVLNDVERATSQQEVKQVVIKGVPRLLKERGLTAPGMSRRRSRRRWREWR